MHTHFWRCICLFSFLEMSIFRHGKPIGVLEFWFCFGYISHYVYTFVFLILYWCYEMYLFFFNWTFLSRKYRICLAVIKKKYHTCQAVISENIIFAREKLQKISYLPVSNFRKYICPAYIFSWQLYHISFVSRIVNSVGDKYIYTLVDLITKWKTEIVGCDENSISSKAYQR
jgi:hypothetical protein